MSNNYSCPECNGKMNIGNSLVFSAKSPDNERGIIFLDTELGSYSKKTHPGFVLQGVYSTNSTVLYAILS